MVSADLPVLDEITADRHAAIYPKLRQQSLPTLIEMALLEVCRTGDDGIRVVGRIAGMSDPEIFKGTPAGASK